MRTLVALGLALLAAPAAAERLAYTCTFTDRCDDYGCAAEDVTYMFRFDTATEEAEMLADGQAYPGRFARSEGMVHFILVNPGGAEMVTILDSGAVTYSGHMGFDGEPAFYRLSGACTVRSK